MHRYTYVYIHTHMVHVTTSEYVIPCHIRTHTQIQYTHSLTHLRTWTSMRAPHSPKTYTHMHIHTRHTRNKHICSTRLHTHAEYKILAVHTAILCRGGVRAKTHRLAHATHTQRTHKTYTAHTYTHTHTNIHTYAHINTYTHTHIHPHSHTHTQQQSGEGGCRTKIYTHIQHTHNTY